MDLSVAKTTEAKKLKVTNSELVFADLLSLGYSEEDAYIISHPEDLAVNIQTQRDNRKDVTSRAKFRQLCEIRRTRNSNYLATPQEANDVSLIDGEDVAKEILLSAKKQPVGSKERADLMAKYNDIRKDNENEVENVTDAINFYLPIKCHQCPLLMAYNTWKKENQEREIRPVEMEGVIRNANKVIKAVEQLTE